MKSCCRQKRKTKSIFLFSSKIITAVFLFMSILPCLSQSLLDKKISVHFINLPLEQALGGITKTYQIKFSYANNLIPLKKPVTAQMDNQPLRNVLNEMLKKTGVSYQQVGNQIVLSMGKTNNKAQNNNVIQKQNNDSLRQDTIKKVDNIEKQPILKKDSLSKIIIHPDTMTINYNTVKVDTESFSKTKDTSSKKINTIITLPVEKPYIKKTFQFAIIPGISTNNKLEDTIVNNFAFNLLVGHSAAMKGFELGLLANTQKDYVKGFQLGGIGNYAGGDVNAVQIGGVINANKGNTKAVRVGGFGNYTGGNFEGFDFSGFSNVYNSISGGSQIAGFANICIGKKKISDSLFKNKTEYQVAGFSNFALQNIKGIQISGFTNVAKDLDGTQIAGFANVAKDVRGTQIGVFNIARKVKGGQIGVFNFCDSIKGVPIGLLSIVRHGYHEFEIGGSESFYSYLNIKLGERHFYNILALGYQPLASSFRWGYGYGLGTEAHLNHKLRINFDLLCYQIGENELWTNYLNLINQLRINLGIQAAKHICITFGPSYSVLVSSYVNPDTQLHGSEIAPYSFFSDVPANPIRPTIKMWIGGNLGLRF